MTTQQKHPNFILGVGAQKAGTTWLFDYLKRHPQCAMSAVKEMGFFSDPLFATNTKGTLRTGLRKMEKALELARKANLTAQRRQRIVELLGAASFAYEPSRYAVHFSELLKKQPDAKLVGDITPEYAFLASEDMEKAKNYLGDMGYPVKVVMLMRDPVSRCFSAARMKDRNKNVDTPHFASGENFLKFAKGRYVDMRTRYELTIPNLETHFDPSQIFYGIYEDFFQESEIKRLCAFLEIDYVEADLEKRVHSGGEAPPIDEKVASEVREHFKETYDFCKDRFGHERIERLWRS